MAWMRQVKYHIKSFSVGRFLVFFKSFLNEKLKLKLNIFVIFNIEFKISDFSLIQSERLMRKAHS